MKRVLFLVNHDIVIYNFRKELVERLLKEGYEVIISSPYGERIELLEKLGCKFIEVKLDRHGKSIRKEIQLLAYYKRIISEVKPTIVFSYTIKPNLYGAIAASSRKVPCVVNITGLGTAVENSGFLQKLIFGLYKFAFRKVQTVFVQNTENKQFFLNHKIAVDKLKLLPGSGVNLEQFNVLQYPDDEKIEFVFISRIMKEKGIDQYLETAKYIRKKYPQTRFHICGFCEEEYEAILKTYEEEEIIVYHGLIMDTREVLAYTHCTIHPSYYPEGMSNVLLESAASGRPIITTDRSGCREIVDDGINGYMIPKKDTQSLIKVTEKFILLSNEDKKIMGLAGRKKVEEQFDRNIVINAYMKEITC